MTAASDQKVRLAYAAFKQRLQGQASVHGLPPFELFAAGYYAACGEHPHVRAQGTLTAAVRAAPAGNTKALKEERTKGALKTLEALGPGWRIASL